MYLQNVNFAFFFVCNCIIQSSFPSPLGFVPVNLYDPVVQQKLQESANLAVQMMDEQTYDFHKVVRILDAQKQIVGGDGYAITFYMGQSQCEQMNNIFCGVRIDGIFQKCMVVIGDRGWENFGEITNLNCQEVSALEALNTPFWF